MHIEFLLVKPRKFEQLRAKLRRNMNTRLDKRQLIIYNSI